MCVLKVVTYGVRLFESRVFNRTFFCLERFNFCYAVSDEYQGILLLLKRMILILKVF